MYAALACWHVTQQQHVAMKESTKQANKKSNATTRHAKEEPPCIIPQTKGAGLVQTNKYTWYATSVMLRPGLLEQRSASYIQQNHTLTEPALSNKSTPGTLRVR